MRERLDETSEAITRSFTSANVPGAGGEAANVVDVLAGLGQALRSLGNAEATSPAGAIGGHAAAMKEAARTIADGLSEVAAAIRELVRSPDVKAEA
jgi:hypothetical protein